MRIESTYIPCPYKISAPMRINGLRFSQWRRHGNVSTVDIPVPDISSTLVEKEK
ncbi:MAG: hypothetical protein HGA41_06275 [Syntrophaceae bacterium]|nr:hypothetical protein [Syntrophaceae bacterium]